MLSSFTNSSDSSDPPSSSYSLERLDHLFQEAITRKGGERRTWIESQCGHDRDLRDTLLSMLAHHERGESALDRPPFRERHGEDSEIHGRLGPYTLQGRLGAGSTGVVYKAVDDDGQALALKVLREEWDDDPARLKWFARESRILSQLRHSGIAEFYGAGRSEGRSWIAMEWVQGVTLRDRLREGELSDDEALNLFEPLCEATEAAHRLGLVHRDLKPSNILVQEDCGQVKILDFGLASLVEGEMGFSTSFSETGKIVGTLAYMSPEQARGRPHADPRSDVYSLGVILYRLLTGELPLPLDSLSLPRALEVIETRRPLRLRHHRPDLPRDLEILVHKALEKDPKHRYGSVSALLEDLRRQRRGEPIFGRSPSSLVRTLAFVRRYKLLVALSLTLWVVLMASTVSLGFLYSRARDAESKEKRAAADAREVTGFLTTMLSEADPLRRGEDYRLGDLLDEAGREIENRVFERPHVKKTLQEVIGRSNLALGRFELAAGHLKEAVEESPTLDDVDRRLWLGEALFKAGRYPEARVEFETVRRLLGDDEARVYGDDWVRVSSYLAGALRFLGDHDRSRELYEEALGVLVENGSTSPWLPSIQGDFAGLLAAMSEFERAETMYTAALSRARSLYGVESLEVAQLQNNLAILNWRLARYETALELYAEAFQTYTAVLGHSHPMVITVLDNRAQVLIDLGRTHEAEALLDDVLDQRIRLLGANHPAVAMTRGRLAPLLRERGAHADAEAHLREALRIRVEVFGRDHESTASMVLKLGDTLSAMGQFEEATKCYEEALQSTEASLGDGHLLVAKVCRNFAGHLARHGHAERSMELYERAFATMRECLPEDHPDPFDVLLSWAEFGWRLGLVGDAELCLEEAQSLWEDLREEARVESRRAKLEAMTRRLREGS